MTVFLSVLKIIGIVLLVILAVALVLAALILLLPVHYKVRAKLDKDEKIFEGNAKATWIAYMFHGEADFKNNKLTYYLKFLGRKKIDSEIDSDEDDEDYESGYDAFDEIAAAPEKVPAGRTEYDKTDSDKTKKEMVSEDTAEKPAAETVSPEAAGNIDDAVLKASEIKEKAEKEAEKADVKEPKSRIRDRINSFIEKIRELLKRPKRAVKNIGYKIRRLCGRIRAGGRKIRYFYELFKLDSSKEAMQYAWKELKFLLWHCRPRKITGYLTLGREDPADTGELAGLLCTLRPVFGKHFILEPDFDHDVLNGDFYMKGYIQLWVVGLVLLKCYYNKNLMRFWRRLKRGKEM